MKTEQITCPKCKAKITSLADAKAHQCPKTDKETIAELQDEVKRLREIIAKMNEEKQLRIKILQA